MDFLQNIWEQIRLAIEGLNTLFPGWVPFAIVGGIVLSGIVAIITYRKAWKDAEKYSKAFTGFILTIIGFGISIAGWVLSQEGAVTDFLSRAELAQFGEYIFPVWGTILLTANKFYELGGSKLWAVLADRIGTWANARAVKKSKPPVFTDTPTHAPTPVETTNQGDQDIFSS